MLPLVDDNRTFIDGFIGFCYPEETERLGTTLSSVLGPLTYLCPEGVFKIVNGSEFT